MLELKGIKKNYAEGDNMVRALKGINLQFRENEFVSILGPSGCGKTTMLNIIGGLDQYTEGDLIIDGKSTKDFKDRDWDAYRNHSIGFVFQSYNLIPHQTVLQNVELALTLSGVSKKERRERAKKALEEVGLGDQLRKRPSEMSGGQMQRVAIARALVNNPEIILADEPTGALDTETSVQVMEILKRISSKCLIIMVTHNPDLAEKYSTRIIRMLDGEIKNDTQPLTEEEIKSNYENEEQLNRGKEGDKKPSMSFRTAFSLSLKNLFTKKGRTLLTSFAGSIGIIGIALIFAVSKGMTTYIDTVQEETLSSYPITIEATHVDLGTLMETFMGVAENAENQHEKDAVYSESVMYDMINSFNNMETKENDLKSFKAFIEEERADKDSTSGLHDALNGVQYTYDLDLLVYTENVDGSIHRSDTEELLGKIMSQYYGIDMMSMEESSANSTSGMSSMMTMGMDTSLWTEMIPGDNGKLVNPVVENQYDVIYGSWPDEYDEVVLVVNSYNEIDDMTLYALGLKSEAEMNAIFDAVLRGDEMETETQSWSYEEICSLEYKVILNSDCYKYDEATGLYVDMRESDAGLRYLYDNGLDIKVSGIIRPKEDATSAMITGSIAYTSKLTEYVISQSQDTEAVKAQKENETIDIFTGLPFKETTGSLSTAAKAEEFKNYVNKLDNVQKAAVYIKMMSIPSDEQIQTVLSQTVDKMSREEMEATIADAMSMQMGMSIEDIQAYTAAMGDEDLREIFAQMITEQIKVQVASEVQAQMGQLSEAELVAGLETKLGGCTDEEAAKYYDEVLAFSNSTYEDNLHKLGCIDLDSPASINLFAASFEDKDVIEAAIAEYNESVDELSEINYTDYVGIMMSSVTTIINAITYVLIAFVAISLIVSSIMIGVITLISVQERTKEIGILRAIGASKRDVSSMFNAETMIIGFSSGLLGILVTYVLCIPINIIIHALTGINNLSAFLPIPVAIVLIIISVLLTLISGIIPSRSAAKKDPVVALRSE